MPLRWWLVSLLASLLVLMSMDPLDNTPEYRLAIQPAPREAAWLSIVFYGTRFDDYRRAGKIDIPADVGWQVIRNADSVIVAAEKGALLPLRMVTRDEPLRFYLIRHSGGGPVVLDDGSGQARELQLRGTGETLLPFVLGGATSSFPASGTNSAFGVGQWIAAFLLLFALLGAIASRFTAGAAAGEAPPDPPPRWEIAACALPLLLTSLVTLLAYFPGSVSFDASLQWVQAAGRGELFTTLGYPATYLMRLMTFVSPSPAPLLLLQALLAAFGAALVLREVRLRGVPFAAVLAMAVALALTPQFPTFFTHLGKDGLAGVGILFFAWALLAAFRSADRPVPLLLLAALVVSGVFAGLMRTNLMPAVLLVMGIATVLLYRRGRALRLPLAGLAFVVLAFSIPNALNAMAREEIAAHPDGASRLGFMDIPLGVFANSYLFHVFSAAVASGVDVPPEDAALFFAIAPREAWAKYDCRMVDPTLESVHGATLQHPAVYVRHLRENQLAMAGAVGRIMLAHPSLILERQACITSMLWHIGVGQRPLQTTTKPGYDQVDPRFPRLAGESRSLWPGARKVIEAYHTFSDSDRWFWLFWRPALPLLVATFAIGMYLLRTRDTGVLVAGLLAVLTMLFLLVLIPFPAYRYAYPAVLLSWILFPLCLATRFHPVRRGVEPLNSSIFAAPRLPG